MIPEGNIAVTIRTPRATVQLSPLQLAAKITITQTAGLPGARGGPGDPGPPGPEGPPGPPTAPAILDGGFA